MRFGIDMGHNVDSDRGATGIRQEDDVIKEVGLELIDMLRNRGHVVVDCTPSNASSTNDSLRRRVKTANDNKVDRFISVHFNKYDGTAHGTESWYTSSAGKILAAEASKNIAALGFTNRGAKKKGWYVIAFTKMPAILVECCFCDAKSDMDLYAQLGPRKLAEAIANAVE